MSNVKTKQKNKLLFYRQRLGFTQAQVSILLGHKRPAMLSEYENGRTMPPLPVALKLGIVLRVPVEFLFGDLYQDMREQIREKEDTSGIHPNFVTVHVALTKNIRNV
jgi:transcriptional regulator with XRE-family HTH domain